MHFLGLAGMPRRIPDYPTIFYGWNHLASIGAYASVTGIVLFLFMVITTFYKTVSTSVVYSKV
jgi:cytochrome c oxidase subunit 1